MENLTIGSKLIAEERQKQIDKHGFTAEHHLNHPEWYKDNQLPSAAMHLCVEIIDFEWTPLKWDKEWFDRLRKRPYQERLIIAGALIAAEIDRQKYIEMMSQKII